MRQPPSCTPPPLPCPLALSAHSTHPYATHTYCIYMHIYIYISHVFFGNFWQFFFDFFSFFYRIFLKHFISCAFLFRAFFGVGDVHHTHTRAHTAIVQAAPLLPLLPFVPRCSLLCVVKWNAWRTLSTRREEGGRQAGGRRTTPNATSSSRLHSALRWAGGKG